MVDITYHLENLVAGEDVAANTPLANTNFKHFKSNEGSIVFAEKALLGHLILRVDNPNADFLLAI